MKGIKSHSRAPVHDLENLNRIVCYVNVIQMEND